MNARRRILPLAVLSGAAALAIGLVGAGGAEAAAVHARPATAHAQVLAATTTGTNSDAYAYKHACAPGQVKVQVVYDAKLGATKRLIEVTNTGSRACGLTYYPEVAIDNSNTIHVPGGTAQTVQPKVPGGLGGAPAFPLLAKQTAYSVLDLDPSHATVAKRPYNEISVIFNNNLPNADTLNFSAAIAHKGNPSVKNPFLGLYRSTTAAANASASPVHR